MSPLRIIDRIIFDEYQPTRESLVLFRFLYALCLLTLALPRLFWIEKFPATFFAPPLGLTYLFFTGFPPGWVLSLLDAVPVVATVYLLCGRAVSVASWVVTLALIVGNAWSYSFGKINHDILFVAAPAVMMLAGWDGRRPVRAWPMALYAWCIGLAMFTAAWQKALSGWLDPSTHAVLAHTLGNISMTARETVTAQFLLQWTPSVIWEAQDIATVLLEGAFIVLWPWRTGFRAVCAFACLFHLGVALIMRITFLSNLLAYAAFVEWRDLPGAPALLRLRLWFESWSAAQVLAAGIVTAIVFATVGNPVENFARYLLFHDEATTPVYSLSLALSVVAAAIGLGYLWRLCRRQFAIAR
jgi:hypothetical protein